MVNAIRSGATVEQACNAVQRQPSTYERWRTEDPKFTADVEQARKERTRRPRSKKAKAEVLEDFSKFRDVYLGMKTFLHQQQWIDCIEGRTPRLLHPEMKYEAGDKRFVMINTPPFHAKSLTLSVDYVTYRICANPNLRVKIISKTKEMAKQFLYAIKTRLTHPRYSQMQKEFGPPEGFNSSTAVWQSQLVYLGVEARDSPEKDPTIEALGMGGHIYGARADLIILDDCIVLDNAARFEGQIRWIQQEVLSRLEEDSGILLIIGTRVDSVDLYSELRNPDRYPSGKSPWTYLAQPAVLQFAERPEDWLTLWPRSDQKWDGDDSTKDKDGLYPRWDGTRLYRRRGIIDSRTWSMVYQQASVSEDSIFPSQIVRQCVNGRRTVGLMSKNHNNHRPKGMDGLYIICSMDPAMSGDTATVVYAVDPETQMRYILDANRMPNPTPGQIKNLIKTWTEKYSPNRWVIEKNAFQLFLTRDEEIRSYLASRGVSMTEHYSSNNKLDPDFGVASLAPLFEQKLIELASTHNSEGMKALVEQFITWRPAIKGRDLKQDFPMACWFAELAARQVLEQTIMKSQSHLRSRYMPRYRAKKQNVFYLDNHNDDELEYVG